MNNNPNSDEGRKEKSVKKTMTTWTRRVTLGVFIASNLALGAWALEPPTAGTKEGSKDATRNAIMTEEKHPSLPFTVTITDMKKDKYPDYLWTKYGVYMDFNPTLVNIGSEVWLFTRNGAGGDVDRYKGTNVEELIQQPGGRLLSFPASVERPYMFGGMWYDASEGKLYQPMHCEYKRGFGFVRQIHLATSTDKGATWQYVGPIMTRYDAGGTISDGRQNSGSSWDGGVGDQHTYVDERNGYVYIFACAWTYGRGPGGITTHRYHVARCAIADKMAPGKWKKFYNGGWTEPGIGGKASYVTAFNVMYNTYLKKYISFNWHSGLSMCTDLSKQDWTPRFKIKGDPWGTGSITGWGFVALDEKKQDTRVGDRILYMYRGWRQKTTCIRIELGPGETTDHEGYVVSGGSLCNSVANDSSIPNEVYALSPVFDSGDPIEARRTHLCEEQDITVSKDAATGQVRSIQAHFKASEIYWRATLDKESGKVDISIDDQLQRTVNLYTPTPTDALMPFHNTGLDPSKTHIIKIVVRDDKDPRSSGKLVKSKWFEYSAETYLATDGFSAIMGKEQWYYLQGRDGKYEELKFPLSDLNQKIWTGSGGCSIGPNTMNSGSEENNEVARKWLAPHDGIVRLEGSPGAQKATEIGKSQICIFKNQEVIYPLQTPTKGYDVRIPVKKNDAIYFVVRSGLCQWDPRVTYVDATGDEK